MAVLKVAHLGHPILRQVAEPVPPEGIGAPEIQRLIEDMLETMDDHDGAGLAAPQVHVSRRVVVYGVRANPRYPDAEDVPFTVLINPRITPLTEDQEEDWEGCLSVPDLRGKVPRWTRLQVEAYGRNGRPLRFVAGGRPWSPSSASRRTGPRSRGRRLSSVRSRRRSATRMCGCSPTRAGSTRATSSRPWPGASPNCGELRFDRAAGKEPHLPEMLRLRGVARRPGGGAVRIQRSANPWE